MATDVSSPVTEASMDVGGGELSDLLTIPRVERDALQSYGLPFPIRLAGYVAAGTSLVSILINGSLRDPGRMALCLALGGAFLVLFQLLIRAYMATGSRARLAIVTGQIASTVVLQHLSSDDTGPIILFYLIGAELQFILPHRLALIGTFLLWPLSVVTEVTNALIPWTQHDILLLTVGSLSGYAFVAVFTRSAVAEVVQRHQVTALLAELNKTHAQLQTYVGEIEELAVTRERNRMAREIHDTLGHYLTIINVQLETAQKLSTRDPERGQAALGNAKRLAGECLGEVRRSVAALRPAALDNTPFRDAVERLADEARHAGLAVHVVTHGAGTLSPGVEVTAYRVIQEALTNVRKHAAARNVWIEVAWGAGIFTLCVRDDGHGTVVDAGGRVRGEQGTAGASFGLWGMRERVAAAGGTLVTASAPDQGFWMTARLPYAAGRQESAESPRAREEARR